MKKNPLLIVLIFTLVSCTTQESKINKLIKSYLFETLYDFQSYEPINTTIAENIQDAEYDYFVVEIAKNVLKKSDLDGYDVKHDINKGANALLVADSLIANGNIKPGYLVTQRFRCKNKIGVYNIYTSKYLINSDLDNIIWSYTYEDTDEIPSIISQFQVEKEKIIRDKKFYSNSKAIGEAFLEKNKQDPAIKTTSSGLQYKIITKGNGRKPFMNDTVSVHYHGRLLNDSTIIYTYGIMYDEFIVKDLPLKGFSEALTLMDEGARWEVYIPYQLGYGAKRKDKMCIIPPYSVLIFEINLMNVGTKRNRYYKGDYKSWGLSD